MRVYFDQNPFDHLRDAGIPSEQVATAMEAGGYELILSESNVQEWAACWKSGIPEKEQKGQEILAYVLSLRPKRYLMHIRALIEREVHALFVSSPPAPFLPAADVARALDLLHRFATGRPTDADRQNMLTQWRKKEGETAIARQLIDEEFSGGFTPVGDTLDQFLKANRGAVRHLGERLILRALNATSHSVKERQNIVGYVLRRFSKCPALRAATRTHLYVNYRVVMGKGLRHDAFDDLRHCINAAYSDVFVTGDEELRDTFVQIRPGAQILTLAQFMGRIGMTYSGRSP